MRDLVGLHPWQHLVLSEFFFNLAIFAVVLYCDSWYCYVYFWHLKSWYSQGFYLGYSFLLTLTALNSIHMLLNFKSAFPPWFFSGAYIKISSNLLDLLLWQKGCQNQIHYCGKLQNDHKFFPSLHACPFAGGFAVHPIKKQSLFLHSLNLNLAI